MLMRWCVLLTGVLLCLGLSTPVRAGIGQGNGEIGFDLGASLLDPDATPLDGARVAFRGGYTKNHTSYVFGFTWRLGD